MLAFLLLILLFNQCLINVCEWTWDQVHSYVCIVHPKFASVPSRVAVID